MKMRITFQLLVVVAFVVVLIGCNSLFGGKNLKGSEVDLSIFTDFVTDEIGLADDPGSGTPPDGTQYYDEIDVKRVAAAVIDDRIYCYVEFVGTWESHQEDTGYGSEKIISQGMDFGIDADQSQNTGFSSGMDLHITFAIIDGSVHVYYGVYENNEQDTHIIDRFDCLYHNGGPGYDYVVFSAPLNSIDYLGVNLAKGSQVNLDVWCEAESTTYHHFAFDQVASGTAITLGGQ